MDEILREREALVCVITYGCLCIHRNSTASTGLNKVLCIIQDVEFVCMRMHTRVCVCVCMGQ